LGLGRTARDGAAVYDVMAAAVRDVPPPLHAVTVAGAAPAAAWERALQLETCGPWIDRLRRTKPAVAAAVQPADAMLRAQGEAALCQAIAAGGQLTEVGAVAARVGVRVMVLKGAARFLGGEPPGRRLLSDIDLLVQPGAGARRLFEALTRECGYAVDGAVTPDRHLPMLTRAGGVPVEIHERLTDAETGPASLEARIWDGAVDVAIGEGSLTIPSPTARVLHTLQHALVVHRTMRYRLRDITDVRTVCAASNVDRDAVRHWVVREPYRAAADTLLAAAGVAPWITTAQAAWTRVRRVAVARLAVPARPGVRPTDDPLVYVAGQLAERSPRVLAGLAWRALSRPGHAAAIIGGFLTRAREHQ
jgi:hypothetical protein